MPVKKTTPKQRVKKIAAIAKKRTYKLGDFLSITWLRSKFASKIVHLHRNYAVVYAFGKDVMELTEDKPYIVVSLLTMKTAPVTYNTVHRAAKSVGGKVEDLVNPNSAGVSK